MLASDLHVHLDGSLRERTLLELLRVQGLVPPGIAGAEFVDGLRFRPGMSLRGCLAKFDTVVGVLQTRAALTRAAEELVLDSFLDGVRHVELRLCPPLHTRAGLASGDAIEAVLDGLRTGNERISSGDPEGAVSAGVIVSVLEGMDEGVAADLVELAARHAGAGIVGVDLAGDEALFDAGRYRRPFARAREAGLAVTVHAGEGHDPSHIRAAILELGARRIGHGTSASSDARLLDLIVEREVTIEVCLSSNVHTGAIERLELHPLPRLLERGVRVALATDNRFFSATSLSREYDLAASVLGVSAEGLARMALESASSAFLDDRERARLARLYSESARGTVKGVEGPSGDPGRGGPPSGGGERA
jgi:adenosine deaminase